MLHINWARAVLLVLVGMLSVGQALQAADESKSSSKSKATKKEKASKKSRTMIRGYYAIIAKELKLSEDQLTKIEAALKDRAAARESWQKDNGDTYKKLGDAAKAARKAKEADKAKALSAEQKKLRAERDKIDAAFKSRFNAALSPAQQTHLVGYSLYIGTMQRLSKAKLTDEQKAKAKAMAIEMGKDVPGDKDARADREFRAAFAEKVKQALLTKEQQAALEKKK